MANNENPGMTSTKKEAKKSTAKKATLSHKDKVVLGVVGMVVGVAAGAAIARLFQRVSALEAAPAIQVSKKAQAHRMAEAIADLRRKQSAEAATMWSADVEKVKEAAEKVASGSIYAKG